MGWLESMEVSGGFNSDANLLLANVSTLCKQSVPNHICILANILNFVAFPSFHIFDALRERVNFQKVLDTRPSKREVLACEA